MFALRKILAFWGFFYSKALVLNHIFLKKKSLLLLVEIGITKVPTKRWGCSEPER